MPFDAANTNKALINQRIAVIGTGISGLSAAWLLSKRHHVVVYEKEARLGGHSHTVDISADGRRIPVDTGFIVFNEPSYPNLTALLDHLDVDTDYSCMSLGVSTNNGDVEYSGQTLSSIFARRSSAASPTFWKMLVDIPRFHKDAKRALEYGFCEHATLGDFVEQMKYGQGFCEHFLKPMAAAIWSTPDIRIFDYPALSFLQFFENHGLLQILNLPEWRTIRDGSRQYVRKLQDSINGSIRANSAVTAVRRGEKNVFVRDAGGAEEAFDHVVIATHADTAFSIMQDKSTEEAGILSEFAYQQNQAVLHSDATLMPRRRRAWSSWNYLGNENGGAVTYWMNRLQNLECEKNVFVTLNPPAPVEEKHFIASFRYDHPMFNAATAQAQKDIWRIQGQGGVWYAGAHLGHGFHEDGLQSGLAVAELIGGVRRPWRVANESGRLQVASHYTSTGQGAAA